MRDYPFKLPQEAVYILRASAIIEGLGTVYIPNFNGVKDILPVLQGNIPRALGTDKNLFDLFKDEVHAAPLRMKQLHTAIQKASEDELRVHLSERQLEWLQGRIEKRMKRYNLSLLSMTAAIFLLLFDPALKIWALFLFLFGALRLLYL